MNNTDGTKRLFDFMENTDNEEFRFKALGILVNLAENPTGKKALIIIIIRYSFIFFKMTFRQCVY